MKKIGTLAALLLAGTLLCACTGGGTENPPGPAPQDPTPVTKELLFDKNFAEGVRISTLISEQMSYTWWKYGSATASQEPYWSLGQYGDLSRFREGYDVTVNDLSLGNDLLEIPSRGIEGKDGSFYTLTTKSGNKRIAVDPGTGTCKLEVDTTKEYVDQATGEISPRKDGEDWAHMILSEACGAVYLAETESVVMELDFTIDRCNIADGSIGAAQFQWIFSVHDKAFKGAAGEKEYFWFNVTLFDNRYEVFGGTQQFDGGKADATGKFIYAPRGDELFEDGGKVEVGKKYHVSLDLKQYMRTAFDCAQAKGAMKTSEWENIAINGFNIGWEVSNVSDVSVTIENMSLRTTVLNKG